MFGGISEKVNIGINNGLSENLVNKAKEAINGGKIDDQKLESLKKEAINDDGFISENEASFISNLDNKDLTNKLNSPNFNVKTFNFDVIKDKKSIDVDGTTKTIESSVETLMNKSAESGKSSYDTFYSILKKMNPDENPITVGKAKILLEARKYIKDEEQLGQINNSINRVITNNGNDELKKIFVPAYTDIDPKLATKTIYTDKELHGHPERYAHNILEKFNKENEGANPKNISELTDFMKKNPPPLEAVLFKMGNSSKGNATDTLNGSGYCEALADYMIKSYQEVGKLSGKELQSETNSVEKVTVSTPAKKGDAGEDKHFVAFVPSKDNPKDGTIIDLWLGKDTPKDIPLKTRLIGKGDILPNSFDTRENWEKAAKAMWGNDIEIQ